MTALLRALQSLAPLFLLRMNRASSSSSADELALSGMVRGFVGSVVLSLEGICRARGRGRGGIGCVLNRTSCIEPTSLQEATLK